MFILLISQYSLGQTPKDTISRTYYAKCSMGLYISDIRNIKEYYDIKSLRPELYIKGKKYIDNQLNINLDYNKSLVNISYIPYEPYIQTKYVTTFLLGIRNETRLKLFYKKRLNFWLGSSISINYYHYTDYFDGMKMRIGVINGGFIYYISEKCLIDISLVDVGNLYLDFNTGKQKDIETNQWEFKANHNLNKTELFGYSNRLRFGFAYKLDK